MFTKSGYTKRSAPIFIWVYAIQLIIFYLGYLMYSVWNVDGVPFEILNYITAFYGEAAAFITPALLCCTALALCEYKGMKYALTRSPVLTLPCALYTLISEYINATMLGGIFYESLLYGFLLALAAVILLYGEAVLLFFVIRFISSKFKGDTDSSSVFDFSSRFVKALFAVCAVKFAVALGFEIYTTVKYLVDYSQTYKAGEIILMIFRYLFIFAEMFACHILSFNLNKKLKKIYNQAEAEEN